MLSLVKYNAGRICLYLTTILMISVQASSASDYMRGQVVDTLGQPIIGVSVVLLDSDRILTGTATNTEGRFSLKTDPEWPQDVSMRLSSLGYQKRDILLVSITDSASLIIELKTALKRIKGFKIVPSPQTDASRLEMNRQEVYGKARTGLVSTNIAEAIQSPSVSRAGSAHSSQLRVYGTSPMYYYNDLPIGYDPNHYGIFTILPAPAISQTSFDLLGTSAEYGLPAVISLTGERRFSKHQGGSVQVSVLDATANYSIGTGSEFLSFSLRKSVLDKLVDRFSLRSEKRTLPPTNFQDVVIAGGKDFSGGFRLRLDGYQTRDYLAYNTSLRSGSTKVSTRQHSERRLVGLHLDHIYSGGLISASFAVADRLSEYFAAPGNGREMYVDLSDQYQTYLGRLKADFTRGESQLTIGVRTEIRRGREVNLDQMNWNFLSPFSNSDNPYIYQQALNQNYGQYRYLEESNHSAAYASYRFGVKHLTFETGLRWESYSNLAVKQLVSFRGRFTLPHNSGKTELFIGTFNESPVNDILEPYQIQILANLTKLAPIHKRLVSLNHSRPRLKMAVFHKEIHNLPTLTPHFDRVFNKDGTIARDFITVVSDGYLNLWGGTAEIDISHLILDRLNGSVSYGYTDAYRQADGITVPYELEAPHTLQVDLNRTFSSKLMLGTKFTFRSGYPYTPPPMPSASATEQYYSEAYYNSAISLTNSERFAPHASLDIYGHYQTGRVKLFWSISNLTNRSNPIISSHSGYIYDAGILPTIGVNVSI